MCRSTVGASAEIESRWVDVQCPTENLRTHFVSPDIVMTHAIAMLSAQFPHGERFFMRSVRRAPTRARSTVLVREEKRLQCDQPGARNDAASIPN
jgi:predicted metal-dependent hydrolase